MASTGTQAALINYFTAIDRTLCSGRRGDERRKECRISIVSGPERRVEAKLKHSWKEE